MHRIVLWGLSDHDDDHTWWSNHKLIVISEPWKINHHDHDVGGTNLGNGCIL